MFFHIHVVIISVNRELRSGLAQGYADFCWEKAYMQAPSKKKCTRKASCRYSLFSVWCYRVSQWSLTKAINRFHICRKVSCYSIYSTMEKLWD